MIYDTTAIQTQLEAQPTTGTTRWLSLELETGDTAWNPSTDLVYKGPGSVVYGLYASGNIYAGFNPPESV